MADRKYTLGQLRSAWGAGAAGKAAAKDFPVGMFFHTRDARREIEWQGRVLRVNDQFALVQLYSWLDGAATESRMVPIRDLLDWSFYATAREWRLAYCRDRGFSPSETEVAEQFHDATEACLRGHVGDDE
jgi:hypothetical protein